MSTRFEPHKLLRKASNALLRQFFAARGALADLPWDALGEADVEPVYEAWQRLDEPRRRDVQVALQDVSDLADERGLALLADEVNVRCPDRLGEFGGHKSRLDKALWTLLNVPAAFYEAARYARADDLATGRYWFKRDGLPTGDPLVVTADVTRALGAALSRYYAGTQARGHWCHVDHYRRANGGEYFFASLDDYPDVHVDFDEAGAVRRRPQRAAFDNVFVYTPAGGTLEVFAPGRRKVRDALEAAFCGAVLGVEVGPADPGKAAFHLVGLKDPAFAFPTEPADGVTDVRLRRLRLEVVGAPGERVTLEVGPKGGRGQLHGMIARYLDAKALPMSAVRATLATVQLTFAADGGGKARTLTFDVSHPNSCNLKSRPDEVRAVAERCLQRWGVAR